MAEPWGTTATSLRAGLGEGGPSSNHRDDLQRDVRFIDARGSETEVPRSGTYADEIVVLSLPEGWIRGFSESWFSRKPFDIGSAPPPDGSIQGAIHAHFDRCPSLVRIGPILDVQQDPDLVTTSFLLENYFRSTLPERPRAPGKLVVAGLDGLVLDYFPHSLVALNQRGFSSGREKTVARWEIEPAEIAWLGPPATCRLAAGDGVIFPSNLLLSRVRQGKSFLSAIGYLRGLHPRVETS